jgi:hypothetical protein
VSRGVFEKRLGVLTGEAVEASLAQISEALADRYGGGDRAWLIEETWSGFVHYIHRDFDAVKWRVESGSLRRCPWEWRPSGSGGFTLSRRKPSIPFITKDDAEAMRFPTKAEAEAWIKDQPLWLSRGDQYQPREHMWVAPSQPSSHVSHTRGNTDGE